MDSRIPSGERRKVYLHEVEPITQEAMKDIKRANLVAGISFLVLGFALAFLFTLAYWALEKVEIFSPREGHIVILDEEAQAGGFVKVKLSYCKETSKPVQFTRSFVTESTIINTPTLTDITGKGCFKDRIVTVPVPPQTATSEYRIRYSVQAHVNPIRTIHEEHYSVNTVRIKGLVDQAHGGGPR